MAPTIYAWVDWKGVNSRKVTASALMSSKTLPQTILRDVLFFDGSIDSTALEINRHSVHAPFVGEVDGRFRRLVPKRGPK